MKQPGRFSQYRDVKPRPIAPKTWGEKMVDKARKQFLRELKIKK